MRKQHGLSQRDLARELQILGLPIDKNAITRTGTDKRCVADIEPKAFAKIFSLPCDALLDEEGAENPGK
nr:XRE family transcriptional regulator [Bittarella massiliensis (ex Durand et al. 2017)]